MAGKRWDIFTKRVLVEQTFAVLCEKIYGERGRGGISSSFTPLLTPVNMLYILLYCDYNLCYYDKVWLLLI